MCCFLIAPESHGVNLEVNGVCHVNLSLCGRDECVVYKGLGLYLYFAREVHCLIVRVIVHLNVNRHQSHIVQKGLTLLKGF